MEREPRPSTDRDKEVRKWGWGGKNSEGRGRGGRVLGTSRQHPLSWPQAQLSEQEPYYATLLRLPVREHPPQGREGDKEDLSTDYACIAKDKPT